MSPSPSGHQLNLGRRLRVVSREENVERKQSARVGCVVRSRDHHLQKTVAKVGHIKHKKYVDTWYVLLME